MELTVGMAAASVVALTLGVFLFYNYRAWTRMQEAAEMQRDAVLAMNTLSSAIRGGWTNFSTTTGLQVNNTNGTWRYQFTKTGDRLVYSVNGGASMDIVQRRVSAFTCASSTNRVEVRLHLTNAMMNMVMTNTFYGRK
jgi:Tfp pilus assembly protein PilW